MGGGGPHPWIGYAIAGAVVLVVLAIRLKRAGVARPLHVNRLWIIPAVYSALAVFVFVETPPEGIGWIACAVALVLGAAAGWWRGRMMHIEVDPKTRAVTARQSAAAVMIILLLVLARTVLRGALQTSGAVSLATATDALIAFALGLLTAQRLEMYLRARRLLNEAETR
jgi:membrane protein CcdC involved in cytochrome C biogenesis